MDFKFGFISINGSSSGTYPTVNTFADLPDPITHASQIYIVLTSTGVWLVNRKPKGMYYSNGASWTYLGDFPEMFDDANFQIYNDLDNTKAVKFDTSFIDTSTIRTLIIPNKDGTIALLSDIPDVSGFIPNSSRGNLTAGSTKISLGGTPTGATIGNVSIDLGTVNLDDLADVNVPVPVANQFLMWNGANWVSNPVGNTSAGASTVFFNDDTVITASGTNSAIGIDTLSKTPATGAEDVDTVVANNNTVNFGHVYLYNTALNVTQIDPGVWEFDTYAAVSNVTGVTEILRNVMRVVPEQGGVTITTTGTGTTRTVTASGGTPFAVAKIDVGGTIDTDSYLQTPQGLYRILTRTSDTVITISTLTTYANETSVVFSVWKRLFQITTGEINNISPAYQLYTTDSVQQAFTMNLTDKLGSMVFARTTAALNITVSFVHNGTTHYSHFHAPLKTYHNDLNGLQIAQSGVTYGHVNDTTQTFAGKKNFSAQVTGGINTLTFNTNLSFNLDLGNSHQTTVTGNITSIALTNKVNGGSYLIYLVMDDTGGYTIPALDSSFGTATHNSVTPLVNAANNVNIINVNVRPDGTTYHTVETVT